MKDSTLHRLYLAVIFPMAFKIFFAIISVLLITVILLQQKSSALGSMMGGDSGDEMVQTRRGADKFLHRATIVLALLFAGAAVYSMFAGV